MGWFSQSGTPREKRTMRRELNTSYAVCHRITRRAAQNFYYSFLLLPGMKRRSMCALYAFLRRTDDLADGDGPVESRRGALDAWRRSLDRALAGSFDDPLLPALADTVSRWSIPQVYLHDVLDGVEMDLEDRGYDTFDELELYCYRVASAVGLACLYVWGFDGESALEPARKCGIAFQLTNILRDVKEDLQRGRVYLPAEDLRRFEYSVDDLKRGVRDERFRALMRFEIERAEQYYRQGAALRNHLHVQSRPVFVAMTGMYRALLAEICRRDGDVFSGPIRLSRWRKIRIAGRAWMGRPSASESALGAAT